MEITRSDVSIRSARNKVVLPEPVAPEKTMVF
jgi:hypothetical protein